MNTSKMLIGFVTRIAYIIIGVFVLFGSIVNGAKNTDPTGDDIAMFPYIIAAVFMLILIDIIRRRFGLSIAMTKKNVKHQNIMLGFMCIVYLGCIFASLQEYIVALILFAIGTIGGGLVRIRIWKVFTEIRESDHVIFKRRLIKAGVISGSLILAVIIFGRSEVSIQSMFYALYWCYLISSLIVGFSVVSGLFLMLMSAVDDMAPSDAEYAAHQENNRISASQGGGIAVPVDLMARRTESNIMSSVVMVSTFFLAIPVGMVMIPFYAYVLITNKVTVTEIAQA